MEPHGTDTESTSKMDAQEGSSEMEPNAPIESLADACRIVGSPPSSADVLVYKADVEREGYEAVSTLCERKTGRENVILILSTSGGSADAAYRISRCLGSRYKRFSVLVPGWCKSAGTLLCIGADELIISDRGELGPLDVQVRKPNELAELGSGLDVLKTLKYLERNAYEAFREFLVDIRLGTQMSTRVATEMATELAVGLYGKIFDQVDPVRVGEVQRLMTVASSYGQRLSKKSGNLHPNALARLVTGYPAHSFVIDRKEARELFVRVRKPTTAEDLIGRIVEDLDEEVIEYVEPPKEGQDSEVDESHSASTGKQTEDNSASA